MYIFFTYLGYLLLFTNFFFYFRDFSKFGKAYRIFVYYLLILVLVQVAMEILTLLTVHNLFLVHVYFIGQFILLGLFYKALMRKKRQKNFVQGSLGLALLVLAVQYAFDPEQFFKFNLLEITVTSLLVVVFAVLHLYNMLSEKKEYYYITVGIIIYLLASTVLFFVGNLTIGLSDEIKFLSWTMNVILVVVCQLFYLYEWKVSFYKKKQLKI